MWFTGADGKQRAHASLQMLALAGVVALLAGCPADDEMTTDGVCDDMPSVVPCPDDLPEMRTGMRARGLDGLVRGELVWARDIPVVKYHNEWDVAFTDPDGSPVDGLELIRAETFMPAHNHNGGPMPPEVMALEEPGQYKATKLNIWMDGPWEVRFYVDTPNGADTVIFPVCLLPQRDDPMGDAGSCAQTH